MVADSSRHLEPGGYLELQDVCFPARCDDPVLAATSKHIKWTLIGIDASKKVGIDLAAPLSWPEQLRSVGFTDIHIRWFNWPIGPWAKQAKNKVIGRYALENFHDAAGATVALFTRVLGWSDEEFQVLAAEVRNEQKEQKVHLYQPVCFCYARKPPLEEHVDSS